MKQISKQNAIKKINKVMIYNLLQKFIERTFINKLLQYIRGVTLVKHK
jgi:hypothetical protein